MSINTSFIHNVKAITCRIGELLKCSIFQPETPISTLEHFNPKEITEYDNVDKVEIFNDITDYSYVFRDKGFRYVFNNKKIICEVLEFGPITRIACREDKETVREEG